MLHIISRPLEIFFIPLDFDDSHSNLTDVNSKFYFRMIAETDIEKTLKNLKVSKATGVDENRLKYSNYLAILSPHP